MRKRRTMKITVSPQTASHLMRLAHEAGHQDPGLIVDAMMKSWINVSRNLNNALAIIKGGMGCQ